MKILHVIRSIDPAGGGPIEGLKQITSVLSKAGHQPAVVSLDSPDNPFRAAFSVPAYGLGPVSGSYGFSKRFVPWLRANATNYDVVVVEGIWAYHSFGVWRALRNSSVPYVVFPHGMLDPWFKRTYPLKHLKKWLYWPWSEYRVLRDGAAVLFTCEEERILARESFSLYKANEIVVSYGSAAPPENEGIRRSELEEHFPAMRGKRLVVFMGRLHPKKGCDLAIGAFAQSLAENPDWHLVLAGPDQVGWQAELRLLAERLGITKRITWTGSVSGDRKWALMRAAEVFFLPSHQENFGVVVAEALSCGVPALISNKVNIWREVKADGAGLIAEDTLEGTTAQLREWGEMSEAATAQMRSRALDCFRQRFEIHHATAMLQSALKEIVDKRTVERSKYQATACEVKSPSF